MITLANFRRKTIMWGLSLVMLLISPLHAFAFVRSKNDNGTVCYYWNSRNVSFSVNENCSQDIINKADCYKAVQNSIEAWTGQSCSDLKLNFAGPTSKIDIGMDSLNLIVWRESANWNYEKNAIAMTTTTFGKYSGVIFDADIEVNGVDYKFSTSGAPDAMDIQNTLTHEMGHCIGLADVFDDADVDATMYYNADYGQTSKRSLSQDDINGLCTIYPTGGETPLCSGSTDGKIRGDGGGCVTTAASYDNIPALAFLALLLWLLRTYFRRVNLG